VPGFDSALGSSADGRGLRRPSCRKPAVLFLSANTARQPAGICAGVGSNRR